MKDKAYWLALAERYFEAETTLKEEARLKRFLATPEAAGSEFDELRAVMGYFAVGRKQQRITRRTAAPRMALYARVAAAAILLLIALPWGYRQLIQSQEKNICVAYVGGKQLTDANEVMALMHQTLQGMSVDEPDLTMQGQLNNLFNTIE